MARTLRCDGSCVHVHLTPVWVPGQERKTHTWSVTPGGPKEARSTVGYPAEGGKDATTRGSSATPTSKPPVGQGLPPKPVEPKGWGRKFRTFSVDTGAAPTSNRHHTRGMGREGTSWVPVGPPWAPTGLPTPRTEVHGFGLRSQTLTRKDCHVRSRGVVGAGGARNAGER